jgi:hypothetical protein
MTTSFLEILENNTVKDNTSAALDILEEFCKAIRDYTGQRLECWLSQGFLVNMGQEWRVMVKPVSRDFEQILLRAYVPLNGFPAWLDIYDEEPIRCVDDASLRENLAGFLRQDTIIETILFLKKQAADQKTSRRSVTR